MNIYDRKLWIADLDEIISSLPELEELAGKKVLVTGCTGLICSAVIDVLMRWNETHKDKITILAAGRYEKNVRERFASSVDKDRVIFVYYDAASTDNSFHFSCDYIIHGANNASPNKIMKEPVETMLSNFVGMKYLLDYTKERQVRRILYISSSEVYGQKETNKPRKTDDYGWIDILNSRSSYSIGKCATETLCISYYDEYGIDSVIIRPGHIYGPTALESDNRVSSVWAYSVARGQTIVMKSDGSQIRSYCYCLDSASAILKVLLKGKSVKAYNISNPKSIITVRDMAEILAESADVELRLEMPTEEEKKGFNPMSNSSLDSTELLALGWKGLFDAKRGFSHTVEIIKEMMVWNKRE